MSDVWSWGILTWELVTGKDAWGHVAHAGVAQRAIVAGEQLPWPDTAPAGFSEMRKLGQSALVYHADARPLSQQLLLAMNAIVACLEGGGRC